VITRIMTGERLSLTLALLAAHVPMTTRSVRGSEGCNSDYDISTMLVVIIGRVLVLSAHVRVSCEKAASLRDECGLVICVYP
jgi:hypothetical protein